MTRLCGIVHTPNNYWHQGEAGMRIGVIAVVVTLALGVVPSVFGGSTYTWRVVKSKSVSGQFAVTATSATIKHPRGIAVRFGGTGAQGQVVWACSKGLSVASWTKRYGR